MSGGEPENSSWRPCTNHNITSGAPRTNHWDIEKNMHPPTYSRIHDRGAGHSVSRTVVLWSWAGVWQGGVTSVGGGLVSQAACIPEMHSTKGSATHTRFITQGLWAIHELVKDLEEVHGALLAMTRRGAVLLVYDASMAATTSKENKCVQVSE